MFREQVRGTINKMAVVLDSNLNDAEVVKQLDTLHDEMKAILTEAYHEQVRIENERKQKETNAKMEKLGLKKCTYDDVQLWQNITYSAFETYEYGDHKTKPWIVWNNLPQVAVQGKCIVMVESWYEEEGGKTYKSRVLENPTWRTLANHADKSIAVTKDTGHYFFEGFSVKEGADGIKTVKLHFGS